MIPLPTMIFNAIAFPLQGVAARNATWILDVLGIPVLRDGNVIHLSPISLIVTYLYQSRGQIVEKEMDAKLQLISNAIMHNRTDGALVRITSLVTTTIDETFARQVEYIRVLRPLLNEFLPQ